MESIEKNSADLAFSTHDPLAGASINNFSNKTSDNRTEFLIELTANDHHTHFLYQVQGVQQLANNITFAICGKGPEDLIEQEQNLAGEIIGDFNPNILAQI